MARMHCTSYQVVLFLSGLKVCDSEYVLLGLPDGLVARIRRSHRRGPGSIPGQGTVPYQGLIWILVHLSLRLA